MRTRISRRFIRNLDLSPAAHSQSGRHRKDHYHHHRHHYRHLRACVERCTDYPGPTGGAKSRWSSHHGDSTEAHLNDHKILREIFLLFCASLPTARPRVLQTVNVLGSARALSLTLIFAPHTQNTHTNHHTHDHTHRY